MPLFERREKKTFSFFQGFFFLPREGSAFFSSYAVFRLQNCLLPFEKILQRFFACGGDVKELLFFKKKALWYFYMCGTTFFLLCEVKCWENPFGLLSQSISISRQGCKKRPFFRLCLLLREEEEEERRERESPN